MSKRTFIVTMIAVFCVGCIIGYGLFPLISSSPNRKQSEQTQNRKTQSPLPIKPIATKAQPKEAYKPPYPQVSQSIESVMKNAAETVEQANEKKTESTPEDVSDASETDVDDCKCVQQLLKKHKLKTFKDHEQILEDYIAKLPDSSSSDSVKLRHGTLLDQLNKEWKSVQRNLSEVDRLSFEYSVDYEQGEKIPIIDVHYCDLDDNKVDDAIIIPGYIDINGEDFGYGNVAMPYFICYNKGTKKNPVWKIVLWEYCGSISLDTCKQNGFHVLWSTTGFISHMLLYAVSYEWDNELQEYTPCGSFEN